MKLTATQNETISNNKKRFAEYSASFEILGESEHSKGFVICELKYNDGRKALCMIGKRGATKWQSETTKFNKKS